MRKRSITDDLDWDGMLRRLLDGYEIEDITVKFKKPGKKRNEKLWQKFQYALLRGTFANDLNLDFRKLLKEK